MEITNKINKTYMATKKSRDQSWHLFDAEDKVLGRLATEIAKKLIGKEKPDVTPHVNVGDRVVVVNAKGVKLTGNKAQKKVYFRHTGYPGGIRSLTFEQMMAKDPTEVVRKAVKRMLPQNKLLKERMKNLFIYSEEEHPHGAQLKGSNV